MGAAAARHARTVLGNVEQIVAIELLCAAQALDLRLALLSGDARRGRVGRAAAPASVRRGSPAADPGRHRSRWAQDREPGPDLAAALALVHDGTLADLARSRDR